jgi:hypothetical protein
MLREAHDLAFPSYRSRRFDKTALLIPTEVESPSRERAPSEAEGDARVFASAFASARLPIA